MRDLLYIGTAMLATAAAALVVFAALAIDIDWRWAALIPGSAVYAGLLVLLGESIIEDLVKLAIVLVLTGLMWANHSGLWPVFLCACIAGLSGTACNQLNRSAAAKALRRAS